MKTWTRCKLTESEVHKLSVMDGGRRYRGGPDLKELERLGLIECPRKGSLYGRQYVITAAGRAVMQEAREEGWISANA